jgi:hypothetical protein
MLLDGWRRIHSRQIFDIGCDADRFDLIEPITATITPREKVDQGSVVRLPRIPVSDLSGEEF